MVSRKKYTRRGGSVNFKSRPNRFSSSSAYLGGYGCPGTYNNATAAGGKYSSKPYMKGGNPVYCLAKNPMLMNGNDQLMPYGPGGGTYASVNSCSPFTGSRPEQMGGQPPVRGPYGQGVMSPAPYPANTVSGVVVGGKRKSRRRSGKRRSGKRRLGKRRSRKFYYPRLRYPRLRSRKRPRLRGGKKILKGGSGGSLPVKGYSSFSDSPANVPASGGKPNLQPYSNVPISFGYSAGGPPSLSPNLSALANPSPHQSYLNCPTK